jgi:FixJ family two-component response regulator
MIDRAQPPALIHVVDDDADFQVAVGRLLRAAGYDVRCYSSAGEFFVSEFDDRPGCILLDVHMPGPSGLDMKAAVARMPWRRPIVFISGHGDIPTTVRAIQAGAVDPDQTRAA